MYCVLKFLRKISLLFLLLFGDAVLGFSQERATSKDIKNGATFEVNLSTNGFGVSYQIPHVFSGKHRLRLETSFLQFRRPLSFELDTTSFLKIAPEIRRLGFTVHYSRAIKTWLYVDVGSQLLIDQEARLSLSTDTGLALNGLHIPASDFGSVELTLKWWRLQPYLGLKMGKERPEKQCYLQG
jgi:hypothetical protein